jgi:hypothetical protein
MAFYIFLPSFIFDLRTYLSVPRGTFEANKPYTTTMADELPVPAQLQAQLAKCKTVRGSDYYKPRTKTAEVS